MWNRTTVSNRLSIQYPIIQAGMAGGITTPELVSAVSNAGGLGMVGAGYMTPEQLESDIRKIKELTELPFGVNLFVPESPSVTDTQLEEATALLEPFRQQLGIKNDPQKLNVNSNIFDEQLQIILKYNVPVCSFTFGIPPKEVIQELKRYGVVVIGTATTVQETILNEEAGMDMIVAQGSEAGGHRGSFCESFEQAMIGTMSLIPQTVDNTSIPVIAAGGIMDARGILSSLILGAGAVQMGTAFVTSIESGAHDLYKQTIINSTEEKTVVTSTFSGKPARGIMNDFVLKMKEHESALPPYPIQNQLTQPIRKEAAKQKRAEFMSLWCGQSPRLSQFIHAAELIDNLVSDVDALIRVQRLNTFD
ncbi:nitronate monooxygenase family protein [Bacillus sp. FJAT-47783]|uniref:NAD(P)H-dependent flavin oxidoreductase n=1 Tax=Bacillus sp. FJAT-47783 TaxID=2922712 RepID=UPI001FABD232|nr:nitronate monooxygenase family protein [Bacillus sp. FJAT-47783]